MERKSGRFCRGSAVVMIVALAIALAACSVRPTAGAGADLRRDDENGRIFRKPGVVKAVTIDEDRQDHEVADTCQDLEPIRIDVEEEMTCFVGEECEGELDITGGSGQYEWQDGNPPDLTKDIEWDDDAFSFSGEFSEAGTYRVHGWIVDSGCPGRSAIMDFLITVTAQTQS